MPGLPKFLIADDIDQYRNYVVHTQPPRFIALVIIHGGHTVLDPHWIDPVENIHIDQVKEVMTQAGEFYKRAMISPDEHN